MYVRMNTNSNVPASKPIFSLTLLTSIAGFDYTFPESLLIIDAMNSFLKKN